MRDSNCVFCKIIEGKIPSYKLYEDENFFAFLDINPISEGHLLIIPKEHEEYLFDMEDEKYTAIMKLAKNLSAKLKEATKAKKIGLSVEGFGEAHAHIHLIPINKLGDFDPCKATRAMDNHLSILHKKLLEFFK